MKKLFAVALAVSLYGCQEANQVDNSELCVVNDFRLILTIGSFTTKVV